MRYLLVVAEEIRPVKEVSFRDVSLCFCTRHVEEMGTNLFKHLKLQAKSFDCHAFAADESNEIGSIAHMCPEDFAAKKFNNIFSGRQPRQGVKILQLNIGTESVPARRMYLPEKIL
jgi:hypothetical protein